MPEDFVVQEIGLDGNVASNTSSATNAPEPSEIYSAVLTKVNLSTTEAMHEIATVLGCRPGQIGIAGKKDVRAVTSQFISLHGIRHEQVTKLSILPPAMRLNQIAPRAQIIRTGDLKGNRFTIKVRARQPFDKDVIDRRLGELQSDGFLNYFGPQRFGPRLNNHEIGRLLLKGEYEEASRALLTHTTPYESTTSSEIRTQAKDIWGDWKAMTSLFASQPHAFRSELYLLSYLSEGKPAVDYWKKISPQARFYTNAFGSYMFNQALSTLMTGGSPLPDYLPTLSDTEKSRRFYQDTLQLDTAPYFHGLSKISQGINQPWDIPSTVHPVIISSAVTQKEAVLCFDLPKGSYATILLRHVFDLYDTVR